MSSSEDSFPSETSQLGDIREHVLDVFQTLSPFIACPYTDSGNWHLLC